MLAKLSLVVSAGALLLAGWAVTRPPTVVSPASVSPAEAPLLRSEFQQYQRDQYLATQEQQARADADRLRGR